MELLTNLDLRKMDTHQLDKLASEVRTEKFKLIQALRSGSEKSIHKYHEIKKYLARVLTIRSTAPVATTTKSEPAKSEAKPGKLEA